mmetsp:Transcript_34853/g.62682  ORF Transcript_34853/g.62682 Transcript_34853/m.62682 type:complete len:282 (-) Transcript_34853:337-1182(-)
MSEVIENSKETPGPINEDVFKEFLNELKDVDRNNEVNRILWAFKLNPFEKMNLRFTATPEEIRRQYRKLSLMVHPDKCDHPQASNAFEILGEAQKALLDDEKRASLLKILNMARDEIRAERKKETKTDNAVKLASLLDDGGRAAVEAKWEDSEEFHERWKMKGRDFLARTEFRKRKLDKRVKDETKRIEEKDAEEKDRRVKQRQHEKDWEKTRDDRVSSWQDYVKKQGKGKGSEGIGASGGAVGGLPIKKPMGMLKPPKIKTSDSDKLYVQRPATRPGQDD